MSMEPSGVEKSQGYVDFSKMDNVVKEAIKKFLPVDTLGTSAVTSKLFQSIMNNKGTWMKMAKELDIKPASAETARAEVITRLKANNYIINNLFPPEQKLALQSCTDPFERNKLIKTTLHSNYRDPREWPGDPKGLLTYFTILLKEISESIGTKEGPDQIKVTAALTLIKEGILSEMSDFQWHAVFSEVVGFSRDNTEKYVYSPEQFQLFQALVDELMNSTKLTPDAKQDVMRSHSGIEYLCLIEDFPRSINYPCNFIETVLKAGMRPSNSQMFEVQRWCPIDLWDKKESPIALILKYATTAEKQEFLKESNALDALNKEAIKGTLSRDFGTFCDNFERASDVREYDINLLFHTIYKYIHWAKFTDQIKGTDSGQMNEKEEKARREWVLGLIDQGEKNVLSELNRHSQDAPSGVVTYIKEFYSQLKKGAEL